MSEFKKETTTYVPPRGMFVIQSVIVPLILQVTLILSAASVKLLY